MPVDGVIRSGRTSINQAVMTGESLPVDKGPGDEVSGGTVNQFGTFEMRATKVGADSSIQRMIRLVQSADAGKAKIIGIAMGSVGSDIAVDAADIALVDNEVRELPHLIALSHRMMTTIRLNMSFSMLLNFVAIVLAIIGTLDPRHRCAGPQRGLRARDHKLCTFTELEEIIMAITIIGIIIGAVILGAGIYYLAKEKTDREARKIYTITTVAGAILKLVLAG